VCVRACACVRACTCVRVCVCMSSAKAMKYIMAGSPLHWCRGNERQHCIPGCMPDALHTRYTGARLRASF
jgi:hypothetical protein